MKPEPVMVTLVPPAAGPEAGDTAVTDGAGGAVVVVVRPDAPCHSHVSAALCWESPAKRTSPPAWAS